MIIIRILKAMIVSLLVICALIILIPIIVIVTNFAKKTERNFKIKRQENGEVIDVLVKRLHPLLVESLGLKNEHIVYRSIPFDDNAYGRMNKYTRQSPFGIADGYNILLSSDMIYLSDAADTYAHEMRHVYQHVNNKYTGKYYNSKDNFAMYYFQAKERDARKYAYEFCKRPDVLAIIKEVYEEYRKNNRE